MQWLCDIRLPAAPRSAARARALVGGLDLPLPAGTREDLRLLVSEVTTNALRHGSGLRDAAHAGLRVRVGLTGDRDRVRVEVHDGGPGFAPAARGPHAEPGSGWGVHFVDRLADRWGTMRSGPAWVVWFELRTAGVPDRHPGGRSPHRREPGRPFSASPSPWRADVADLARTG